MLICLLIADLLSLCNFRGEQGPLSILERSYPVVLAFPVAGSLLARVIENRRAGNEAADASLR